MLGCALPSRGGLSPVARKFMPWFASQATWVSSMPMSILLAMPGRLAVAQRRQDADAGIKAGEQVGDRNADLLRRSVGLSGRLMTPPIAWTRLS